MLEENINIIMDELSLAFHYGRPSIILVSTDSKNGRDKAIEQLKVLLKEKGRGVFQLELNGDSLELARTITEMSGLEKRVIFVSKLDHGGGSDGRDAYRLLNFYREYLIDNKIKIVLWLTPSESAKLPGYSPDFWSFRHLALHISHIRQTHKQALPGGVLLWHIHSLSDDDSVHSEITYRYKTLEKLPDVPEFSVARMEILYALANLYWRSGNNEQAQQVALYGLQYSERLGFQDFKGQFLNSLGIIKYEDAQYLEFIKASQPFVSKGMFDPIIASNLSVILSAVGQNHLAQKWSERCIRKTTIYGAVLKTRGYLQAFMGKYDEAMETFKLAAEKKPTEVDSYLSLAVCSHLFGLANETKMYSLKATEYLSASNPILDACLDFLSGERRAAVEKLHVAMATNVVMRKRILRDPNIFFLFDEGELD